LFLMSSSKFVDIENFPCDFGAGTVFRLFPFFFNTLVGKRISYYYDRYGISVQKIADDELIVTEMPSGKRRTWTSLQEQLKKSSERNINENRTE
jgi:hypothetical protein